MSDEDYAADQLIHITWHTVVSSHRCYSGGGGGGASPASLPPHLHLHPSSRGILALRGRCALD